MTGNQKHYSHHHFILPFVIKGRDKNFKLKKSTDWKSISKHADLPYLAKQNIAYAHQRYFNDEAMEIIIDSQELVQNYLYRNPEHFTAYRISYFAENDVLKHYDLTLDYVLLRYHPKLDAAFLIISATNDKYQSTADFQRINQYGRRFFNPFLSDNLAYSEAPNDLELIKESSSIPTDSDNLNSYQIMSAPKHLLQTFFDIPEQRIFPENNLKDAGLWLDTITDDRMFVHSYCQSEELNELIPKTAKPLNELTTEELKKLYELAFIDQPESPTCQSEEMLEGILADTVYARWSEWGSLYLVTQHSMLYLAAGTDTPGHLFDYFVSEYLDIVLITMAQRVGLLKYSNQAGANVNASSKTLLQLQRNFVMFKNQFLLPELSAQEQAIDIYQLTQENLRVEKYLAILNDQINSLHEIGQKVAEVRLNKILLILSVATLLPILPFVETRLDHWTQLPILKVMTILHVATILVFVWMFYSYRRDIFRFLKRKK